MKISPLSLALSVFALPSLARADVRLPALFGPNIVLQRQQSIPIFGTADAGEMVTVQLAQDRAVTRAGSDGKWMVRLAAREAAEGLQLTVSGKNTIALPNVAVGEVWLCSGQSNMEYSVTGWPDGAGRNAQAEIASANFPNIRLFTVAHNPSATPQNDVKGNWAPTTPATVARFSAVAYYFGRELHQKLNVPVGLIHSSWGGTAAESWTSREMLANLPNVTPGYDNWQAGEVRKLENAFAAAKTKYQTDLAAWQTAVDAARAANQPIPAKPVEPQQAASPFSPSTLFNGMIAPLMPFGIKGVIWYQGESNSGRANQYGTLFPAMIRDWRARWGQGDFPFYFVQLANYQRVQSDPVETGGWPSLREAQAAALSLPRTGLASAVDLNIVEKPDDIHPTNKQDVGHRLALIALAKDYGQTGEYSGPVFGGMTVNGAKVRLQFSHTEGGLKARGDALKGFAIAGADGVWHWADATIDGDAVVLSSPKVSAPTKVRYGWAANTVGNLYNGAGLPATPFRTDTESVE
ncbi:MAG TPA: sialate O-acetylesterase [Abditibacterium sp.]